MTKDDVQIRIEFVDQQIDGEKVLPAYFIVNVTHAHLFVKVAVAEHKLNGSMIRTIRDRAIKGFVEKLKEPPKVELVSHLGGKL